MTLIEEQTKLAENHSSSCIEKTACVNDVDLCYFEWGQEYREGETILLVHATGFHARCWDKIADLLPGKHIVAIDMRGHGRSDNTPPISWQTYGDDLSKFVNVLELNNIVGVGHSMGGHSVVQAAAFKPGRFTRLLLVDPVIMAPEVYTDAVPEHGAWPNNADVHPVAKRRNFFKDADAMFANFQGRGSYGLWREDVLRDYCEHGIVPNPEGDGYVLACPPEVEATIYMGSASEDVHKKVREIQIPVKVLRAKMRKTGDETMDFSSSPTWEFLADEFKYGRDVYLPELTHFIPMQDPGLVARHILEPEY